MRDKLELANKHVAYLQSALADLRSEILDAQEGLGRSSFGGMETNLTRWLAYIDDDLAFVASTAAESEATP